MSEFSLIDTWFQSLGQHRSDVTLGVGDDAAIVDVPTGKQLLISVDTLISGVHFPEHTKPEDIAWKALAVNLSDMAAMGADPNWFTLALTLPESNDAWLKEFSAGLQRIAARYGVQLVGGDTTKGPLSITLQIHGSVDRGQALRRDGARPGDLIYVSGSLGDAGLGLLGLQGELTLPKPDLDPLLDRLNRPTPRVELGKSLSPIASAAIDLSDGLAQDLGHILDKSHVGATLYADKLPLSDITRKWLNLAGGIHLPLNAGDDYELCFTIPEHKQGELEQVLAGQAVPCAWIGTIDQEPGLRCITDEGIETLSSTGYQHF